MRCLSMDRADEDGGGEGNLGGGAIATEGSASARLPVSTKSPSASASLVAGSVRRISDIGLGDYEKVFTEAKLGIELSEEERYFHGKLMKVAAVHSTRPGDATMQVGDICSAVHGQGVLLTDEHSGESSFDRVRRLVQGHPSRPITLSFVHAPPERVQRETRRLGSCSWWTSPWGGIFFNPTPALARYHNVSSSAEIGADGNSTLRDLNDTTQKQQQQQQQRQKGKGERLTALTAARVIASTHIAFGHMHAKGALSCQTGGPDR